MVYIKWDCKQAEYRYGQSKSPCPRHNIPLQDLKVRGWCVASVHKILTPVFVTATINVHIIPYRIKKVWLIHVPKCLRAWGSVVVKALRY